jgi:N-acetylneuraminate lyase
MSSTRYHGLVAATLTPMAPNGDVMLDQVTALADLLIAQGVNGFYVCGSTGEGISLTIAERKSIATAFIDAAAGRVPVIVQVGHNSLREAHGLAAHAAEASASAVSATCPSYFKVNSVDTLVDCMAEIASGAPELPFYYYHIPSLTGNRLNMQDFLRKASERIPNLVGMKYTTPELHDFQQCLEMDSRRFEVLWGVDEMLLPALTVGAQAAIGSTYNIAAPLYRRIVDAFSAGDLNEARLLQLKAVEMISVMLKYPFHGALKFLVKQQGVDVGRCRLPQRELTVQEQASLQSELEACGYYELIE